MGIFAEFALACVADYFSFGESFHAVSKMWRAFAAFFTIGFAVLVTWNTLLFTQGLDGFGWTAAVLFALNGIWWIVKQDDVTHSRPDQAHITT